MQNKNPYRDVRFEDRRGIYRKRAAERAQGLESLPIEQVEWEAKFCAAVMTWPDEAIKDCGYLLPEIFIDERYAGFWKEVLDGKDPIDSAISMNILAELATLDSGSPILQSRYDVCAERIGDLYYLRNSLANISGIANAIAERDVDKVESIISNLSERQIKGQDTLSYPSDAHNEFVDTIREISKHGSKATLANIPQLDKTVGGFYPGEMVVIAARPSMGKTALALQIARNVANGGKKSLFLSLEMTREQLWARMACPLAGLDWTKVRTGEVSGDDLVVLEGCSENLSEQFQKDFIIADSSWSIPDIYRACIAAKPSLIILDQLSEVVWYDETAREVEWYGKAVRFFKNRIGKKLGVPFILLHSLNRATEMRTDKRPQLADLKWSGDIEQAADIVLMPHRPDYYERPPRDYHANPVVPYELWTMKHRQGWLNQCSILSYDLSQQWFT